ncbi:hypothetical protein NHJ13734_005327 [Beauveria thailandica]
MLLLWGASAAVSLQNSAFWPKFDNGVASSAVTETPQIGCAAAVPDYKLTKRSAVAFQQAPLEAAPGFRGSPTETEDWYLDYDDAQIHS